MQITTRRARELFQALRALDGRAEPIETANGIELVQRPHPIGTKARFAAARNLRALRGIVEDLDQVITSGQRELAETPAETRPQRKREIAAELEDLLEASHEVDLLPLPEADLLRDDVTLHPETIETLLDLIE